MLKCGGALCASYIAGNILAVGRSLASSNLNIKNLPICTPANESDIENMLLLYKGKPSESFVNERMSESVVFEDPLTCAIGIPEVFEIFRALKYLEPTLNQHQVVSQSSDTTRVYLNVNYRIFRRDCLVESILEVHYNAAGKIVLIREQWNDVTLLQNILSRFIRRANGILCNLITTRIK